MFNEHARHYRRQGAELIVVPRATGRTVEVFLTAGAMASIVSGCYVVSSNRVGHGSNGPVFGGKGFACGPGGNVLAMTSQEEPVSVITIEVEQVRSKQAGYPCYVAERV